MYDRAPPKSVKRLAERFARTGRLGTFPVSTPAMEPRIKPGDVLVVDFFQDRWCGDGTYMISEDPSYDPIPRLLDRVVDGVRVTSVTDPSDFIVFPNDQIMELLIVGRVVAQIRGM